MAGLNLNLLDQLTFYGSYHSNKWNQLIHFFCVPAIVWSVLVWCDYTGSLIPTSALPAPFPRAFSFVEPTLATFVALCYSIFYMILDIGAGLSWTTFLGVPLLLSAQAFHQVENAWMYALVVHVLGWYLQIHPGHAILEKRKPALLDSFFQSLLLAPLFVWFELLFLLGLYPRLYKELQARVKTNIQQFKAQRERLLAADNTGAAQSSAD